MRWSHAVAFAVLCVGCRADKKLEKCRAACVERFGGHEEQCTTMCTRPCSELHATYGINEEDCAWLQSGAERPLR